MSPEPAPDLAVITKQEDHVVALVARARVHRITDDESRALAADLRGALKGAENQIEDVRLALVKPLNDHVKWINAKCRPLADALAGGVRCLDTEIGRERREREAAVEAARREQERLLEEQRRKAEEEQAARAREIAAQAQTTAVEAGMSPDEGKQLGDLYAADELAKPVITICPPPAPPPPPKTIAGTTGATVTLRQIWDFEVTDLTRLVNIVPDAIEVKRQPVLDHLRMLERRGLLEFEPDGSTLSLFGIRAFKRDSVSG